MHDVEWQNIDPTRYPDLWVIVGETASGKSELALRLAERWNGEIVSVDSVQVYRHFDIGSGKPGADEIARVRHHLVDARAPDDPLDAGSFAAIAQVAIEDIRARGRRPIVCGGTFLWVKALVFGLAESAPANAEVRARHRDLERTNGRERLHEMLRAVDPVAAATLAPNDFVRVSRALEVFELTGQPQSAWHRAHAFNKVRYEHNLLRVRRTQDELDARIRQRAEDWLANGWVEEVQQLVGRGYGETRAMASVGYREVKAFVDGVLPEADLLSRVVQKTRIFARRQRTWLRDLDITCTVV